VWLPYKYHVQSPKRAAGKWEETRHCRWLQGRRDCSFHLKRSLAFSHEEADTRLLLHAKHAWNPRSRVIIQSPDTDLLVLCATHFESISCEELWFKTGVRDHHRYVPVHRVSEKLGQKLCRCLPAFHALTGCDTTSALAGVLKKAWERLSRNKVHQDILGSVGQTAALDDLSRATCEAFPCDLHPAVKKQTSSADELRYFMLWQKRRKSELLPPTSDSVLQTNQLPSLHLEKCFGSKTTPTLPRRKWPGKD